MTSKIPRCQYTKGCKKHAQPTGYRYKDGSIGYRKKDGKYICSDCHFSHLAVKNGTSKSKFLYGIAKKVAAKRGMTLSQYQKQWHPYHHHRKDYCENAIGKYKGWLPVPCSITKMFPMFLSVDHLDGDHKNNDPDNLMTLCHNCHQVKTWIFDM